MINAANLRDEARRVESRADGYRMAGDPNRARQCGYAVAQMRTLAATLDALAIMEKPNAKA